MERYLPLFSWLAGSVVGGVMGIAAMALFKQSSSGYEINFIYFVVGALIGLSTLVPAFLMYGDTRGIGSGLTASLTCLCIFCIGRLIGIATMSTPEELGFASTLDISGVWDIANMGIGTVIAFLIASGLEFEA